MLLRRSASRDRGDSESVASDRRRLMPFIVGERRGVDWQRLPQLLYTRRRAIVALLGLLLLAAFVAPLFISTEDHPRRGHVSYAFVDADYDVGCNGHPLSERINEQLRVLASIRNDLIDSSNKYAEVNRQYESLVRQIPSKQSELALLVADIESARREYDELRRRRNVRVYLPHQPLAPPRDAPHPAIEDSVDLESIDYSRCSISSPLRVFVYEPQVVSPLAAAITQHLRAHSESPVSPSSACLFAVVVNGSLSSSALAHWSGGRNHLIINIGAPIKAIGAAIYAQSSHSTRPLDYSMHLTVPEPNIDYWKQLAPVLPYTREHLMFLPLLPDAGVSESDLSQLAAAAATSDDKLLITKCAERRHADACYKQETRVSSMRSAHFTVLTPSPLFQQYFVDCLRSGSIPVVLGQKQHLPFQDTIDWRLASMRVATARFPEVHFILRSISIADLLEMRRKGRFFLENYLMDTRVLTRSLLSSLSLRLGLSGAQASPSPARPLFSGSLTAPLLSPVNATLSPVEDEYLGPLEAPLPSASYTHNFTRQYSYHEWNSIGSLGHSLEFLASEHEPPAEAEFAADLDGYRPIRPGSGVEFQQALGGNRQREQFTVVLLTYNRDAVLAAALERLHRCPYLNKVIVVWNNIDRQPLGAWPKLHVPVEFVKASVNSLNNRFLPLENIETEAVLSLDDDLDLKQYEVLLAFRVWRESRERVVGFPARFHARFGDSMFYNSNHTCQFSMILTGAAFIHKQYLWSYSHQMPAAIRAHIDSVTNCEDIAMNMWVSHLTRKPPVKTTSKWTLRCPNCPETLSQDESHFSERHACIRLFSRIYGYNPLRLSQFRADSVLFKTKVPAGQQKCFRYV